MPPPRSQQSLLYSPHGPWYTGVPPLNDFTDVSRALRVRGKGLRDLANIYKALEKAPAWSYLVLQKVADHMERDMARIMHMTPQAVRDQALDYFRFSQIGKRQRNLANLPPAKRPYRSQSAPVRRPGPGKYVDLPPGTVLTARGAGKMGFRVPKGPRGLSFPSRDGGK